MELEPVRLQTFSSSGAGDVIEPVRYKHSAPPEPARRSRRIVYLVDGAGESETHRTAGGRAAGNVQTRVIHRLPTLGLVREGQVREGAAEGAATEGRPYRARPGNSPGAELKDPRSSDGWDYGKSRS
jgi:hypothetical protein